MTPDDFAFLARLLRRRSGLSLTPDRAGLAERRLAPVMRRFGFRDLAVLIAELRLGQEALADAVTEAMTVNDTAFFRDPESFAALRRTVLPRLAAARGARALRIWSAGCATGQEAYSIAMLLGEMKIEAEIVATDLSAAAIHRAQSGRYAGCEIERGLTPDLLDRHFRRDGGDWVVEESLRRRIVFRRFNLLDSFGWLDALDLVFCRNVLMYFDGGARDTVLEKIADSMADDGVLLLDGNEVTAIAGFRAAAEGPGIHVRDRKAALARAS